MPAGGGYIAVYRSVFVGRMKPTPDRPACDGFAWLSVIGETRFKADGDLRRGEVRLASRELAEAMGWTRGRARRFIANLEKHGEIEPVTRPGIRPGNRPGEGRAFRLVNYEELQPKKADPARQPARQPARPIKVRRSKKGKKKGFNGLAVKRDSEKVSTADGPVHESSPKAKS